MAEAGASFDYVAFDASGRRVRGAVVAPSEADAFAGLKGEGLSPLSIKRRSGRAGARGRAALSPTELEALLGDLAVLLGAGADIRTALSILAGREAQGRTAGACERLSLSIAGGEAVEAAFAALLAGRHPAVPAVLAAAEAGGDLAAGFERAAEVLRTRRLIAEQLVGQLSYPAFVLASGAGAVLLILLVVIPSLQPLIEGAGARAAPTLAMLLAVSSAVRDNGPAILLGLGAAVAAGGLAARAGLLARPLQRAALGGPPAPIVRGLVFGAFARSLGALLAAGAPMAEALRLAIRTASWTEVQSRLEPVLVAVRQGEALSSAMAEVKGLPPAIARLAAVGEASGSLGGMLARAGAFEEARALKRIEAAARLIGPLLIVLLGAMVGLLMAALLSGMTGLGEAALT